MSIYLDLVIQPFHILIVFLLFLTFFLILLVFFLFYRKRNKNMTTAIDETKNLTQVTIDLYNKTAKLVNIKTKDIFKIMTLDEYLATLAPYDNQVKQWLYNQLSVSLLTSKSLELYINNGKTRNAKIMYLLLQVSKINRERNLIHIEEYRSSELLKNRHDDTYIKTKDSLEEILRNLKETSSVMFCLVSFYNQELIKNNEELLDKIEERKIIDLVLKRLKTKKNRFIVKLKNSDFIIASIDNIQTDRDLITHIEHALSRYFTINNLAPICFNMAIAFGKGNSINYKVLLSKCRGLSNYKINNKIENNQAFYYVPESEKTYDTTLQETLDNEAKEIIEKGDFTFTYRPILNLHNIVIRGYILKIEANTKTFIDHPYFFKTVARNNLYDAFFKLIQIRLTHDFNSKALINKNDISKEVFIPLPINFVLNQSLTKYLVSNAYSLNLVVRNEELSSLSNDDYTLFQEFLNKKGDNCKMYLSLSSPIAPPLNILKKCEGVIVSNTPYSINSTNINEKILYHSLIDQLNSLNLDIIISNVTNLDDVETLLYQGIFSLEGTYSELKQTLASKPSEKLKENIEDIKKKYY